MRWNLRRAQSRRQVPDGHVMRRRSVPTFVAIASGGREVEHQLALDRSPRPISDARGRMPDDRN